MRFFYQLCMQNYAMPSQADHIPLLPHAYLPPCGYMALLLKHGRAQIELFETYPKQTWRNRCRIATANGPVSLSIPVERPSGNHTMTLDVYPGTHLPWQKIHWRSIRSSYSKAPFFLYYSDPIEAFFLKPFKGSLHEWNHGLLHLMMDLLRMETLIEYTTDYCHLPPEQDLRLLISPKRAWPSVKPEAEWPSYYQVFDDRYGFIPNLSVIDLLFHMGPESSDYLKQIALIV